MKAKRICAWCGQVMGYTETPDGSHSHGICDDCLWKHFQLTKDELHPNSHPAEKNEESAGV